MSDAEQVETEQRPVARFAKRFWGRVAVSDEDRCWNWRGYKNKRGYGLVFIAGKLYSTHKAAWMITRGHMPNTQKDEQVVCHHCDNPSCVNPDHLFLSTQAGNMLDAVNKNRLPVRGAALINKQKTHCSNGHLLAGDNLVIVGARRSRRCLICSRASARDFQRKRRAAAKERKA